MQVDEPLAGLPSVVRRYLHEITGRCQSVLGEDMAAVYLTGSAACGAYRPKRSDLDVVAVTATAHDPGKGRDLTQLLRHESLPCPARKLEFVLYERAAVASAHASRRFALEINDGPCKALEVHLAPEERPGEGGRFWYDIDLAILRDTGLALFGPPPAALIAPPPQSVILAALLQSVRWHAQWGAVPEDVVLNAGRALLWARTRHWTSKADAGRWLMSEPSLPQEQRGAVRKALEAALHPQSASPPKTSKAALQLLDRIETELAARLRSTTG